VRTGAFPTGIRYVERHTSQLVSLSVLFLLLSSVPCSVRVTQRSCHRHGRHQHHVIAPSRPHLLRWRTATRDIRNGLPVSMHGLQHAGRHRLKKPHKDRHGQRHAHDVKRDRLCASGEALLHRTLQKIGRRVERLRKKLPVVQEQVVSSHECQVKTSWRGPAVTKMKARWYGARSDEEEELHEKRPARQLICFRALHLVKKSRPATC